MQFQNIVDELAERKLISESTDMLSLRDHLSSPRTVYCGFDPTADSLHIGNLVPLITLRRFQDYGHRPIALIGGATALIGDPAGKVQERELIDPDTVKSRTIALKEQVSKYLDLSSSSNGAIILDNHEWISGIDLMTLLRDYGKCFSMKELLDNKYVKTRLEDINTGISFTEFTYTILQSIDFVTLNKNNGCSVQIGGSDQWGNITNGTRLARALKLEPLHGFTLPLLMQGDGTTKFGKTEKGAVWLDPKRTPVFDFYQYWLNSQDNIVQKLFNTFSLKSVKEIEDILATDFKNVDKRFALRSLSYEMAQFIHGESNASACRTLAKILFPDQSSDEENRDAIPLTDWETLAISGIVPTIYYEECNGKTVIDVMFDMKLAKSRKEAKRFINDNGIKINMSEKVSENKNILDIEMIGGKIICIKKGKSCGLIVKRFAS